MIYCPSCGGSCLGEDIYCSSCGGSIEKFPQTPEHTLAKNTLDAIKEAIAHHITNLDPIDLEITSIDFSIDPFFGFKFKMDETSTKPDGSIIYGINEIYTWYFDTKLKTEFEELNDRGTIEKYLALYEADLFPLPEIPQPVFPKDVAKREIVEEFPKYIAHNRKNSNRDIHYIADLENVQILDVTIYYKIHTTIEARIIGDNTPYNFNLDGPKISKKNIEIGKMRAACSYCSRLLNGTKICYTCNSHICENCAFKKNLKYKSNYICPNKTCIQQYNENFQNLVRNSSIWQLMDEEGQRINEEEIKYRFGSLFFVILILGTIFRQPILNDLGYQDYSELNLLVFMFYFALLITAVYSILVVPTIWVFRWRMYFETKYKIEFDPDHYYYQDRS